jgi:hypothetical protein
MGLSVDQLDKGSASFLKKRSKKLLSSGFPIAFGVPHCDSARHAGGHSEASAKSFLVLFFKKEPLASC